jgi:hypothetical protein
MNGHACPFFKFSSWLHVQPILTQACADQWLHFVPYVPCGSNAKLVKEKSTKLF